MFSPEKPLPPPPSSAKPRNESLAASMPSYRNRPGAASSDSSGFSFSSTKSMFESLNKPEIRNGIMNAARNPTVQRVAVAAAKDERVRNAAISAARDPQTREAAINAAQQPTSRGSILGLAKQFENKPLMGISQPVSPAASNRESWNTNNTSTYTGYEASQLPAPPQRDKQLYPSLTGDSAWQNRGPSYDNYNSGIYSPQAHNNFNAYSTTSTAIPRPRSTDHSFNALVDELFPIAPPKKAAPARPPPPKLGSRSIPNLSAFQASPRQEQITEPHAIVKYPYKSDKHDELNCEPNDTVLLKREVDGQWIYAMNTRTGQSGIIPISFLSIKVPLVPTASSAPMPSFKMPSPIPSSISTYAGFLDAGKHRARALYDYDTGVEGDLKFKAGDIIDVIERIDVEWLRGEVNFHRGIFPLNYVDIDDLTSIPLAGKGSDSNLADSFAKLSYKPKFVTALYNYYSGVPEDLVFEEGDKIQIVEELGGDWIKGSLNGREGLVPMTYVERDM